MAPGVKALSGAAADTAATTAKALAKNAADTAADAAQTLSRTLADATGDAASMAATALARKGDEAAQLAAKQADELAGVAAKQADEVADAAATGATAVSKGADDVAGAAASVSPALGKRLQDAGSELMEFCAGSKMACASPFVIGGALYINNKMADLAEKERACVAVCLPNNFPELTSSGMGGLLSDGEVEYTSIEDVKIEHPDFSAADVPDNQPLCNENFGDCAEYCTTACGQIHTYDGPGVGLIELGKDVVEGGFDWGADLFGDLLPDWLTDYWWVIVAVIVLMVVGGLYAKFKPAPAPRY